jgi:hypothetical protein
MWNQDDALSALSNSSMFESYAQCDDDNDEDEANPFVLPAGNVTPHIDDDDDDVYPFVRPHTQPCTQSHTGGRQLQSGDTKQAVAGSKGVQFALPPHTEEEKGSEKAVDEDEEGVEWSATRSAIVIGPCSHDWLFPHMAAVVHHGG